MDLNELFNMLAQGELQNLSLANEGTIIPSAKERITRYVNEALLELYSKFVLKENALVLQLHESINFYHLLPRFSIQYVPINSADDEPIRYILDVPMSPFRDEVIKVTTVFDSLGVEMPLNNETEKFSIFTPQAKVLQIPDPTADAWLTVRYQQRHRKLTGVPTETIECPEVLVPALTAFVAYKAYTHTGSAEGSAKAQEYLQLFSLICDGVVDRDLVSTSLVQTNVRFERGGWI